MTLSVQHLWLIPAVPLVAAAVGALTPRRGRGVAAGAAIAAMAVAFLLSCGALATALADPAAHQVANFSWFDVGPAPLQLGWLLDPLTGFMCVMVTFVGLLIFVFSLGYMHEDANFTRFFCFLSLFASAMLGLVVANSLLLLFINWELVGLASYLLIGFWFERPAAAAAAKKAFITTRIGDLGFFLGLVWLFHATGTLLFYDGGNGALEPAALAALTSRFTLGGLALSSAIGVLLFCGAIGKSGQFPLHVWLPDAMEGPTPVSALIHAATMVAAGVFLMARVFPLMQADRIPALAGAPFHALTVVAAIGAITALLGALIAVAQDDIKRVLAFSTVSQLGYMMLALGVGSWVAAVFHLLTHAFFKALLFLGAGSVIHAAHHEQDLRRLGGLARRMKTTFVTFAVGMMALSGVPFLFAGFWSKEGILHAARAWPVSQLPLYAGLAAVILTAFYMTRLIAETFFGRARSPVADHAHESPTVMTFPLGLLAVGSIGLGFLGTPVAPWLQDRLLGRANTPIDWAALTEAPALMTLSILFVCVGIGAGWALYWRRTRPSVTAADPIEAAAPRLFAALGRRLGFDALYAATVGRAGVVLATTADLLDRHVWDGVVKFVARLGEFSGAVHRELDEDVINGGFDHVSNRLRGGGRWYSRLQTGDAHAYLRFVAIGFVVLVLLVMLGGGQ